MTLSIQEVIAIKRALWEGEEQTTLAERMLTTQATISRIKNGHQYSYIAWPDGTLGAMPHDRARLLKARKLKHRTQKQDQLIQILDNRINARRAKRRAASGGLVHVPQLSQYDEDAENRRVQEIVERLQSSDSDPLDTDTLWEDFASFHNEDASSVEEGSGETDAIDTGDPLTRWEAISDRHQGNRMVQAARATDDPVLKRAVVLAIEQVSAALRNGPAFPRFVAEVAESLRPIYSASREQDAPQETDDD